VIGLPPARSRVDLRLVHDGCDADAPLVSPGRTADPNSGRTACGAAESSGGGISPVCAECERSPGQHRGYLRFERWIRRMLADDNWFQGPVNRALATSGSRADRGALTTVWLADGGDRLRAGIADCRDCNRRTQESRSIHSLLPRLVVGNGRTSSATGTGAPLLGNSTKSTAGCGVAGERGQRSGTASHRVFRPFVRAPAQRGDCGCTSPTIPGSRNEPRPRSLVRVLATRQNDAQASGEGTVDHAEVAASCAAARWASTVIPRSRAVARALCSRSCARGASSLARRADSIWA
jgi:hypothetical protein